MIWSITMLPNKLAALGLAKRLTGFFHKLIKPDNVVVDGVVVDGVVADGVVADDVAAVATQQRTKLNIKIGGATESPNLKPTKPYPQNLELCNLTKATNSFHQRLKWATLPTAAYLD